MRTITTCLICFWGAVSFASQANGQLLQRESLLRAARANLFRTWTDRSGNHQTVAKYLRHDREEVTIMKENRLVLVIPFSSLSQSDINYVAGLRRGIVPLAQPTPAKEPEPLLTPAAADQHEPSIIKNSPPQQSGQFPDELPTQSALADAAADNAVGESNADFVLTKVKLGTAQQLKIANEGLLIPLEQKETNQVQESLNKLSKEWPEEPIDELIWAVSECAESGNFFVDEKALQLLSKSDPARHIAIFERACNRQDFGLRRIAYESLVEIKSARALSALLRKFDSDDNVFIGKLLPEFGSSPELQLQKFLSHEKPEYVLVTCAVLGDLGTESSVKVLNELAQKTDKVSVRQQANSAIEKIKSRQRF